MTLSNYGTPFSETQNTRLDAFPHSLGAVFYGLHKEGTILSVDTMSEVTLRLPEPPSSNRYWRRSGVRLHLSKQATDYRTAVYAAYVQTLHHCRVLFPSGPIAVTLDWHSGRKSGDLDNRLKQVLDALQGVAYANDGQIVRLTATRHESPRQPYLVVTIFGDHP